LGLEIHESPALSANSNYILESYMAVTIEPGIYLAKLGGIRIEDVGIINKKGIDILTKSCKDIIVL